MSLPTGESPAEILADLENERALIAAEVHDGLLPYLFAAAAAVDACRRGEASSAEQLARAADWIDQARQAGRRLMSGLVPSESVQANPVMAAQTFLNSITADPSIQNNSDDTELTAKLYWHDLDLASQVDWTPSAALAVFRIICEAVRNSLRHAESSRIDITVERVNGTFTLTIRDDGCGFDVSTNNEDAHGLRLMRQRSELAGFALSIASQAEQGTTVRLTVPAERANQSP